MKRIIVTADDYGMCDVVDKAIDEGIENRFISTTNVMVNMESLENAKTLRERYPHISIGLHWNVTTGFPVSAVKDIPTLVREDGSFYSINEFKSLYRKGKISPDDLERELVAQYRKFEAVCGHADYWNTHENSALSLVAFKVFSDVAQRFSITATRTFQRVYFDKIDIGPKREIREFVVRNFFELWFSWIRKTFKMPNARIVSFDKISKLEDEGGYLLDALLKNKKDLIEVVFHPAIINDSPYFGNISDERVKEYKFVSSAEIRKKYTEKGISFVSFDDL